MKWQIKKKFLWQQEKNRESYLQEPIRLPVDFTAKSFQPRREWHDTLKVLKGKNLRLLYPAGLSFYIEGGIKLFR